MHKEKQIVDLNKALSLTVAYAPNDEFIFFYCI